MLPKSPLNLPPLFLKIEDQILQLGAINRIRIYPPIGEDVNNFEELMRLYQKRRLPHGTFFTIFLSLSGVVDELVFINEPAFALLSYFLRDVLGGSGMIDIMNRWENAKSTYMENLCPPNPYEVAK